MASIEKLAPELDRLVSPDAEIEQLGSGYGSDNGAGRGTPVVEGGRVSPLQ